MNAAVKAEKDADTPPIKVLTEDDLVQVTGGARIESIQHFTGAPQETPEPESGTPA